MSSTNAEVTCTRFNHNGNILASCSADGGISLNVAASGDLLSRFFNPSRKCVNSVSFSSGSRFLASGSDDGCVRIWDIKTQEVSQTYNISTTGVNSVTFSGYTDDFIVAGSACGSISVCSVQSPDTVGCLMVDIQHPVSPVTNVLASPHPYARQVLGSTYEDGSVRVWDVQTGQLSAEFAQQHSDAATALALSPVSKVLLATGGMDSKVRFFDTQQQKELRLMSFRHPVTSLSLCADGKTLAVGTMNGEILIYDLRGTITPLYSTAVQESAIRSLHFASPPVDSATAVFPQGQPVISMELNNSVMQPPLSTTKNVGNTVDSTIPKQPEGRASEPPMPRARPSVVVTDPPTSPLHESIPLPLTSPTSYDLKPNSSSWGSKAREHDRAMFRQQLDGLYGEMEQSHRAQETRLLELLQDMNLNYEVLIEENRLLRYENEKLKAHILSLGR